MPTISVFYGITVRMFFRDHAPPHFHVEYSGHKAEVTIDTLDVLAGELPRAASTNSRSELNHWSRHNEGV